MPGSAGIGGAGLFDNEMSLFTQTDLIAAIPNVHLLMAMEDDQDSDTIDSVFESILADAERWISGYLEQAGLEIPDPVPSRLRHAGIKYAEYMLHRRRNNATFAERVYEEWIRPASKWLERIATGAESLVPITADDTPGGLVAEPSKLNTPAGGLMI